MLTTPKVGQWINTFELDNGWTHTNLNNTRKWYNT